MWAPGEPHSSSFTVEGGKAAPPFPRDVWCAAEEGERDSHYPAALEEADAGVWGAGGGF